MGVITFLLALLVMRPPQVPTPDAPSVTVDNGQIAMRVYLPDAQAGYYRGTRFDWSGVIVSLRWRGHEYFGPWFSNYDPRLHDAITGPVEEFLTGDSSVGYAEAPAGGTFVRIGVGHVRKPDEPAYRRFATYEIVDAGAWTVDTQRDRVIFTHALPERDGYGYSYRKTLRLQGNTLVIEHSLRNTGRKRIDTSVYNHNFFTLDRRPTSEAVSVTFPFVPRPLRPLGSLATLDGRVLRFTRELGARENVFSELEGFDAGTSYDFRIAHRGGAAVRIRGNRPLTKVIFWSAPRTVCPEPYVDASAAPGEESTWELRYDFEEAP